MSQFKTIIAIPSYGRYSNNSKFCTANYISNRAWKNVIYYVEPEERSAYHKMLKGKGAKVRTTRRAEVPKKWGAIMDLIIDDCCEQCDHLVIMDDDLALAVRPQLPNHPTVFTKMTDQLFDQMISELQTITSLDVPLTSTQYRQFSQEKTYDLEHNQRISMIWSLCPEFFQNHPEFRFYRQSRLDFMSDYYFFVKLLKAGYPNLCINKFVKDDKPNALGGESSKRTIKMFNTSVKKFCSMFPDHVSIRKKVGKRNWKDGMLGVTIRAKKIFKDAQSPK